MRRTGPSRSMMIFSGRKRMVMSRASSSGLDSTIWGSQRLIMTIGRKKKSARKPMFRAVRILVLLIFVVFEKIVSIFTAVTGVRIRILYTYCRTGTGKVRKVKIFRYLFILTATRRNFFLTVNHWE